MKRFLLSCVFVIALFGFSKAQVSLTNGSPSYSQDFDAMGITTSLPANWRIALAGSLSWATGSTTVTQVSTVPATPTTGGTYNWGSAAAERAIGAMTSGTFASSNSPIVQIQNNGTSNITQLTVSYDAERYRRNSATAQIRVAFSLTGETPWTNIPAGDVPTASLPTGASLYFNPPEVIPVSAFDITGINIVPGSRIYLMWDIQTTGSNSQGICIDNVSITASFSSNTITTGTVFSPPFVLTDCGDTETGTVDMISTGIFNAGNIFRAQLSDELGSFAAPVNIGAVSASGTNPAGSIPFTIPAGTVGGNAYRIRVISTNPATTGTESAAFTITQQGVGGCASAATDHYRSVQTGNWGSSSTWESSPDNSNWIAATQVPSYIANSINILNGHTVTITADASADQLVIQNGGILIFSGGVFTVNDGTGDDINIQSGGIFTLSQSSTPPSFSGSATCNVSTGGRLRVTVTGLTAPGAGVNASNFVYQHQSILEYTVSSPFSSANVTFFPNVDASTIPIFRVSNFSAINVGATTTTTINGIFESAGLGGVTWQSSGLKIFRNGIRGFGNVNGSTSGKFIINGITAELGGGGSLTVPTAAGLEIGSAGGTTVTMISNKTVTGNIILLSTDTYVELGNNNLTVTGTISGGGSNAYIRTNGTGLLTLNTVDAAGKTFPIGNTSYNPLVIANGNNANYSVRVENGIEPAIAFPAFGINRTWNIGASVPTPGVNVTFQYALADANASALPQPQNMEILLNSGTAWGIINNNIPPLGADPFTVTNTIPLNIFDSPTPYALGLSGGYVLPLDYFITARAQKLGNTGRINWNVYSTDNVLSFEVQRSSGGAYQTIATIPAVQGQLVYQYMDELNEKGTLLYRIRVNRLSGGIRYSNTAAIINDSRGLLITSVSPNPVQGTSYISISAAKTGLVQLELYNISGQRVMQYTAPVAEGNNTLPLNMQHLPRGIYRLQAIAGNDRSSYRVVR